MVLLYWLGVFLWQGHRGSFLLNQVARKMTAVEETMKSTEMSETDKTMITMNAEGLGVTEAIGSHLTVIVNMETEIDQNIMMTDMIVPKRHTELVLQWAQDMMLARRVPALGGSPQMNRQTGTGHF